MAMPHAHHALYTVGVAILGQRERRVDPTPEQLDDVARHVTLHISAPPSGAPITAPPRGPRETEQPRFRDKIGSVMSCAIRSEDTGLRCECGGSALFHVPVECLPGVLFVCVRNYRHTSSHSHKNFTPRGGFPRGRFVPAPPGVFEPERQEFRTT